MSDSFVTPWTVTHQAPQFSSIHSVMSDSLQPPGQHARPPCTLPNPRVYSNSCPLSWFSSSVVPFSSCLQSLPASGSFPMSWLFSSGGQSFGASASVLPMNIQHWFPLGLTGLPSLQFKGLSRFVDTVRLYKASYIQDVSWWSLNFKYFFNNLTFILLK